MKNLYQKIIDYILVSRNNLSIEGKVKYSLKKYRKTYDLLEEYDKTARSPEEMADAGRLRPYIQELQKKTRAQRANPAL